MTATVAEPTTAIRFDGVSVHYRSTPALIDFSLTVARGETVALLGPSGSGKSTALKALAGFLQPSSGRILLDGRDVTNMPPFRREIGVVVQQYALFPHMRVSDNVAFGLRARHMNRTDIAGRVEEMLALVGMSKFANRLPRELSGGQQQRVAIARALAIRPRVLLLDEPLSALDAQLRQEMVGELQGLRRSLPDVAMLYVTHDQAEALALADRIAVMRDARLVDVDTADRLYHQPPSQFTAAFLGGANLLPGMVLATTPDGGARVQIAGVDVPVDKNSGFDVGDQVLLCVRPHALELAGTNGGLPAQLVSAQWRGASYRLGLTVDGDQRLHADVPSLTGLPAVGEPVTVRIPADAAVLIRPDAAK